jgi:hypothetical protein
MKYMIGKTSALNFGDSDSSCRSGTGKVNPCALKIDSDRITAATLTWISTGSSATSLSVSWNRDVLTPKGTKLSITLSGFSNLQGDISTSASTLGMQVMLTLPDSTSMPADGWSASWVQGSQTLIFTTGSEVFAGNAVSLDLSQLSLISGTAGVYPMSTFVAVESSLQHTTVIVKSGAKLVSYTTTPGDPLGSYALSPAALTISPEDIVTARVYAYNSRFKSAPATSLVQARAILKPQAPAYFPAQSQISVGVVIGYSPQVSGKPCDVTVKITPPVDLPIATSVLIKLDGFDGANFVSLCPACQTQVLDGQNTMHTVFSSAAWVKNTSSLILTVGEGATAQEGIEYVVVIPAAAGILYPYRDDVIQRDSNGMHATLAYLNHYRLDFVSPFPTVSQPRKGFLVQLTTDRNWLTDIQTIVVQDKLNKGARSSQQLSTVSKDVLATDTNLALANATSLPITTYKGLVGELIQINDELLRVKAVLSASEIKVARAQKGTAAQVHASASLVSWVKIRATDPSKGDSQGLDRKVGTAGNKPREVENGCLLGRGNFKLGCNVAIPPVQYLCGIRSMQTAFIFPGLPLVMSLTNCGTSGSTCAASCLCSTPALEAVADLGSTPSASKAFIQNTGNPLQWPSLPTTILQLSMTAVDTNIALVDSSMVTASYLLIDKEIVYVRGAAKNGISSVLLYQAYGTAATGTCSCSMTGAVSGGGTCSCLPLTRVAGCTSGGTLHSVGGSGTGFRASFSVSQGTISGIEVENPGHGYVSMPQIVFSSEGHGCLFGNDLRFLPVLSRHVVQVERGAFGTDAATHAAQTTVSTVTWPLGDRSDSPGTQYYFRIAAYNDAGVSDYLYYKHRIADVAPNILDTAGGTPVEITMEGGGFVVANTTVYVGHTYPDGTIDFSR